MNCNFYRCYRLSFNTHENSVLCGAQDVNHRLLMPNLWGGGEESCPAFRQLLNTMVTGYFKLNLCECNRGILQKAQIYSLEKYNTVLRD